MSIVFSAIVPHSPLFIPSIGKDNLGRLKDTIKAFSKLEEELYASQPDTILIISPHGMIQPNSFSMNLSPNYNCGFEQFGDFSTKIQFAGDVGLAYKIRERMETRAPLQLISELNLDHGCAVPLFMLASHMPNVKVIPLYYSGLDLEAHFKFGQLLRRELLVNKSRVAIIASGDLSHSLTKEAPAGYSPKAKKFDKKVMEILLNWKVSDLLSIDKKILREVSECGLKSIVILTGILDGYKHEPHLLSYEFPFGVGYLTMGFHL